ncbi:MAG: GFA family protein [Thermoleophilia bacterium]|nr:GFA family protein [Thermoleophilia bacterium]GIK77403.1 MAG: hypothetical protein BroJett022_10930 [Actinomycetes bacterium]
MGSEADPPTATPLTGGCGCGAVRWELSELPIGCAYCHCTRCRRRTGTSVSMTALARADTFTITAGEGSISAWRPETGWHKHFCGECGSALFTTNPEDDSLIGMRMGGFDEDPGVRPAFHQFTAYAPAWAPVPDDGLPRFEERVDYAKLAEEARRDAG